MPCVVCDSVAINFRLIPFSFAWFGIPTTVNHKIYIAYNAHVLDLALCSFQRNGKYCSFIMMEKCRNGTILNGLEMPFI